jgi:glutathione synthase/RimK-type ligase-like ATP-grasp enzyme
VEVDLHAVVVQAHVRAAGRECHIVECDRIAQRNAVSYGINYPLADAILTSEGRRVALSDGTVLWLRRMRARQSLDFQLSDSTARTVIDNDCGGALTGFLATHFRGKWISTPEATFRAADKIGQLEAARDCGFRVPRTLVTQSRDAVVDFYESCGQSIVVKTIVGAPGPFLQTVKLADPYSQDESAFAAAPAIFQECIEGYNHLRLNCFGNNSYTALIRSETLDWRTNLNVPVVAYTVAEHVQHRVRAVLDRLGLEMGVVDLKLTPEEEVVWLEVNPQGQFLFLDGLTDLRLAQRFAAYLIAEHEGRK